MPRVLLLAAKPIGEPVVQYGPFVMNTREEIEQAIADYQSGALTKDTVRRIKVGPLQAARGTRAVVSARR